MTVITQNACIYDSHTQTDYDAFEHAVRVFVEPESLTNGMSVLARCCTCNSAVDSFEYATRNTNAESPGPVLKAVHGVRIVPEMLVLAQIGSVIRRVIKGRLLEMSVRFDGQVKVGDDLIVEVQLRESTRFKSQERVYFAARIGRKIVAECLAIAEASASKHVPRINPFFAAGLFAALVNTRLPGPGAMFKTVDLTFDNDFSPSESLRTMGSIECVESDTGLHCLDLFCMSSSGIVAHARARVQPSNSAVS